MKHIIAIARFSEVPPTYFFPDDAMQQGAASAEVVAALSDDNVREMALRRQPVPQIPGVPREANSPVPEPRPESV